MANNTRFVNNTRKVISEYRQIGRSGMYAVGVDVMRGSGNRTPKRLGSVRRMTSIKTISDTVIQLGWHAAHAAVQNIGHRRGARPFKKYTTPGTGRGFVQVGFEYALKRYKEHFK